MLYVVFVRDSHVESSTGKLAGCNGFCTNSLFDQGQTLAITFPFTKPSGIGPQILESLDQGKLSPVTQTCPEGTYHHQSAIRIPRR